MNGEVEYDVIIIGGGIAGLSAALYTARHGLRTLIVSIDIGGQLTYAGLIENYPGVEVARGMDLVLRIQKQVKSFNAEILIDEVVGLDKVDEVFVVRTRKGRELSALAIIAACGKAPRKLNLPEEEIFVGKGVSYCAICDAPFYRGKEVVLVSLGEKAVESLSLLAPLASHVYLVTPSEDKALAEEAKKYSNVSTYLGYRVIKILGETSVEGVVLMDSAGNSLEIAANGIFIELGFETKIDFLRKYVELNEKGEVIVDKLGATKTKGLFAAGDLIEVPYKQAIIAASSGVVAALSAINYVYKVKGLVRELKADWSKVHRQPEAGRPSALRLLPI